MAIDNSLIDPALPVLPNELLPDWAWGEFLTVYKAINKMASDVSIYTGIDPRPQEEWAQSPPSTTILNANSSRLYVQAAEIIQPGQIINLANVGGDAVFARLASANSAATMAHGIAMSGGNVFDYIEVYWLRGFVTSIGGMIQGNLYWLSPTPGAIQNIAPNVAGTIAQAIGLAYNSSQLLMDISLQFKQN